MAAPVIRPQLFLHKKKGKKNMCDHYIGLPSAPQMILGKHRIAGGISQSIVEECNTRQWFAEYFWALTDYY
jgi:hypothetical protein